ncbi:S-layer homology domain-containing protein [Paenibacillus sp. FSL H8-0034]|uniref:S-layer homology domain-containing protein n=1 Tax=Paenibacillus sp. FSL H8-0034 TaxID=2954671 RepID=UPI0030F637D4
MRTFMKSFMILFVCFGLIVSSSHAVAANVTYIRIEENPVNNQYYGAGGLPYSIPVRYKVLATMDDGTEKDVTASASYSSSNPNVGTMTTDGTTTGNLFGSTIITAVYGGVSGTKTFEVFSPMNLSFDTPNYSLHTGEVRTFTLKGGYNYHTIVVTDKATYSSSDPDIATVGPSGITALKQGKTTITAVFGTIQATATVFVSNNTDPFSGKNLSVINQQKESAIRYLNEMRQAVGVQPLQQNDKLDKASQAHSNYLNSFSQQQILAMGLDAHNELAGQTGFTGISPQERMLAFGYINSQWGAFIQSGETIAFMANDNNAAVRSLLDAPYHRIVLLDPNYSEVGVGINVEGPGLSTVINPGSTNVDEDKYSLSQVYYPYPNQTDVPRSWFAAEFPNPLRPHAKENTVVGYPISISNGPLAGNLVFKSASIKDKNGNEIPYYHTDESNLASGDKNFIFLIPKDPLEGSMTYTVHIEADVVHNNITAPINKTWSFITKQSGFLSLSADPQSLTLKVEESVRAKAALLNDDRTTEDVSDKAQWSSSNPDQVKVEGGRITAISAIEGAEIEVSYQGLRAKIKVDVQASNIGTGSQPNSSPLPFKDVDATYWAADTIRWAVQQNMINGFEDGTFRPDHDVSEAEFAAMLFRAYGVKKETGKDTEGKHWAEPWYLYAKSLNGSLQGYPDDKLRDKAMSRLAVAELITGADGYYYSGNDAIQYLLAKGYSTGKSGRSIEGYLGNDNLTRAEALQFIKNMRPLMKELKSRPTVPSPKDQLPSLNAVLPVKPTQPAEGSKPAAAQTPAIPQVAEQRNVAVNGTITATYNKGNTITVEGTLKNYEGKDVPIQLDKVVNLAGDGKLLQTYTVHVDSSGHFKLVSDPLQADDINVFVRTDKATYALQVHSPNSKP